MVDNRRVQRLVGEAVGRLGRRVRRPVDVLCRGRLEGGVARLALVIDLGDVAPVRVDVVLDGLDAAVRQQDEVFPLGAVGAPALGVTEVGAGVVVPHVVREAVVYVILERGRLSVRDGRVRGSVWAVLPRRIPHNGQDKLVLC